MTDVLRSFGYLPSNEDISDRIVLCVDDAEVPRVPHVIRRNFDADDLVGFCKSCPSRIYAQDIGASGCTEDRCINCSREDRNERSGVDR